MCVAAGERAALDGGALDLDAKAHLLAVEGDVETFVRFDGPARLRSAAPDGERGGTVAGPDAAGTELRFDGPRPVTVGFREPETELPTVTVPPSPEGVATALTHAPSALETLGPGRSHPERRGHPPLVAFGEHDVPRAVRAATPDTGIEFVLPPALPTLCVAAPLSFYLGASVTVDRDCERPLLRAPDADVERRFPAGEAFATDAAGLLRRVFYLDCLARDRPAERLAGREALDRLGLDADALRDRSPAARLRAYLDAPFGRVAGAFPEWPLATYVDGGARTVRCLPYLLDRLSLVHPAAASEMDGQELLRRALDGFYRGSLGDSLVRAGGDVASADRLAPDLRDAHLHGWLAEGTPVQAFKSTPRAYRNRLAARADRDASLDIAVVCNDREMTAERAVADIYRDRADGLPVDVSLRSSLTRRELAELLATPHDFVHYIGHCERDGLRCPDGYLDASDVETVRTRTFFLNACGSYRQGRRLIARGSVAGAVTLTTVLDRQAATVGTAFARLLIHGFGFQRALSLARQQILMGSDYAVVGDGTYAVVPTADPALLHVTSCDGGFEVVEEVLAADAPGRSYRSGLRDGDRLHGRTSRTVLSRRRLVGLLRDRSLPVVHDGELCWSRELAATLADT
jgi:hypothetical protein